MLTVTYILGIPIGSINIDELFDDYIKTRLRDLNFKGNDPSSEQVFQDIKASLGTRLADGVKAFQIPIPGLGKRFSDQATGVSAGCVNVNR